MFPLIYLSFLLLQIVRIHSESFINYCFKIYGYYKPEIVISFNSRLHFVPNDLELTTLLKENTYDAEMGILKAESFVLQKVNHQCTENFVYHVPASQYPILTLEISLNWGYEAFLLDLHTVIMKQGFTESLQVLQSARENILMPVFLKHGHEPLNLHTQQHRIPPLPEHNEIVRPLLLGESYCMSFFDKDIEDFLIFSSLFITADQLREYYILTLSTETRMNERIDLKSFLIKVYPCYKPVGSYEKFRIFVDPTTRFIQFDLSNEVTILHKISHNVIDYGNAITNYISLLFDFDNLEVNIQPLTQEIVDNRVGILLYESTPFTKKCDVSIPENIGNLELAFIYEQRHNGVVSYRLFRSIDMEEKKLKIYKIRPGTQEEYERCIA